MNSKMKSFVKGIMAGLVTKARMPVGEPVVPDEPVGYFYGHVVREGETPTHTFDGVDYVGVVLPDIRTVYTEEMETQYPCAFIYYRRDYDDYRLVCSKNGVLTDPLFDYIVVSAVENVEFVCNDGWQSVAQDQKIGLFSYVLARWSNFDLSDETGLTVLTKTCPIPIYE